MSNHAAVLRFPRSELRDLAKPQACAGTPIGAKCVAVCGATRSEFQRMRVI
jgi:hypothetical protein